MKILFIRHGKSIDDANGISQRNNSPLSHDGRLRAEKRTEDFVDISPSACYTSHYRRAKETTEILFPSHTPLIRQDIFEIRRPALLDGGAHTDAVTFWEVTHKADKYLPEWSHDGSESFLDVTARARAFLKDVIAVHVDDTQPIVVVTHGGFIRHCIGVACMDESYRPEDFYDLLLPMKIDNLDAIELTLEHNQKPSWRKLS